MIKCCHLSNQNITSSCTQETQIIVCFIPFFAFMCIPFTIIFFLFLKSIQLKKSNLRKRTINIQSFSISKGKPDNISRICSICQEEILFSRLLTLRCHHYFHQECIQKWLERNNSCPICRHNYRV